MVWTRGEASSEECPTSYVTPQSIEWVERYRVWKAEGGARLMERNAREAEALLLIENAARRAGANREQSN